MNREAATIPCNDDPRLALAHRWLEDIGLQVPATFTPVAGDASFRRYFRLTADGVTRVLMDAPPENESVGPFRDICARLRRAGLCAPEIIHADADNGFLLLEDLGDTLYKALIDEAHPDRHMPALFDVLKTLAGDTDDRGLPPYDASLLRMEMDLFPKWYLGRHRPDVPRDGFEANWGRFCNQVIASALDQPRCFVHRDFHSCNLLRTPDGRIGVIDFQDAVSGPVSYDFCSLVWDRYITWPRPRLERWMEDFRQRLGLDIEPQRWVRYCDLMGLQRNFKVVGIFARLYYRDGKQGYIEMIPRFYGYLADTLRRYPEFGAMLDLLERNECAP